MLGSKVKIDPLPFSFYFSRKNASRHGIRLKIFWNDSRIDDDRCGYIELHGNYRYSQDPRQKFKPKAYMIETARYFAKKYKVLFAAVWEGALGESEVQDFFKGQIFFKELVSEFYADRIGKQKYEALQYCNNLKDLEARVRQYSIFNMND